MAGQAGSSLLLDFRLFLIAYAPLFAIFAVQSWPNYYAVAAFIAILIWALIDLIRLMNAARRGVNPVRVDVLSVEDDSGPSTAYLATYILPFVTVSTPWENWQTATAILLYFAVLFVVFRSTQLGLVNPTLYLVGYQIVQVVVEGHAEKLLVVLRQSTGARDRLMVAQFMGVWIQSDRDGGRDDD